MPQKAQLLLQLAQAAAKVETRQQGVLPSVAVNVWDTITGTHPTASTSQQQQQQQQTAAAAARGASADHGRLPAGLNFLHFGLHPSAASSHAQQLLAQQAAALHQHWGMHPAGFPPAGQFQAAPLDTAAFYDNAAWGPGGTLQHAAAGLSGPAGPLLHAAAFPGLPRPGGLPAAPRPSQRLPLHMGSGASSAVPQPGGTRKARFNNSVSLNKAIMNTHSARDLHTIVRSKGSTFDFFNISSAIARVPKLVGGSGGVQVRFAASMQHA